MVYKHQLKDNKAIFELEGALLNEGDRLSLRDEFQAYLDQDIKDYLIDLSALKHINSTGLGVFITLYTKVRSKGGEMIICNPTENITNLLTITKLTSVFTIVSSVEEGLQRFTKK